MEAIVELCKRRGIASRRRRSTAAARRLGLRPSGRRPQGQREGVVEAHDDPAARRHRRTGPAILMTPACGRRRATSRASPTPWWSAATATPLRADHLEPVDGELPACPNCVRATGASPRRSPDVRRSWVPRTTPRASVAAPRDRAGDVRRLPTIQLASRQKVRSASRRWAAAPQRDHPPQLHLPVREFEQIGWVLRAPRTDDAWHEYWIAQRWNWYRDLGVRAENLRIRDHARTS